MNIPTVKELRQLGLNVKVGHQRRYRGVNRYGNGKIRVFTTTHYRTAAENIASSTNCFLELLPTGGLTTVTVTAKDGFTFTHTARCRSDENYNKKVGVRECLEKITYLMLVCDGKDGFKMPFQV